MSNLRRRLERLERLEGGSGYREPSSACPECGIDPDVPPVYEVVWEDPPTEEELREWRERREAGLPPLVEASTEPEMESSPPCPRCGRQELVVVD
jgi:hypothetical protein